MKLYIIPAFAVFLGTFSILGAVPASVENLNYKVTLSETQPGLDDQAVQQAGPTITVAILDKMRNTRLVYPLQIYAIHYYFLRDEALDLVCRTTLEGDAGGPRYSFIQLNLNNTQDSRQFPLMKRFSFSPDGQTLLAVLDGSGAADPVVLLRIQESPPRMGWIYSSKDQVNLFTRAQPALARDVTVNEPVGWSADSSTAAFVVSSPDGTKDGQDLPIQRDYLACLRLSGEGFRVAAQPLDLIPYHYHNGSVITEIKCNGDKATLSFVQSDSSSNLTAEFPLPPDTPTPPAGP